MASDGASAGEASTKRHYWLTAGLTTVICTIVTIAATVASQSSNGNSGSSPSQTASPSPSSAGGGGSGGNQVPSGFQGEWQGTLTCRSTAALACRPPYPFSQVRHLKLHSGGLGQVVGETTNETAHCTADVYLSGASGTALTLNLVTTSNPDDRCVAQGTVEVRLQDAGSLWYSSTATDGPFGRLRHVG